MQPTLHFVESTAERWEWRKSRHISTKAAILRNSEDMRTEITFSGSRGEGREGEGEERGGGGGGGGEEEGKGRGRGGGGGGGGGKGEGEEERGRRWGAREYTNHEK